MSYHIPTILKLLNEITFQKKPLTAKEEKMITNFLLDHLFKGQATVSRADIFFFSRKFDQLDLLDKSFDNILNGRCDSVKEYIFAIAVAREFALWKPYLDRLNELKVMERQPELQKYYQVINKSQEILQSFEHQHQLILRIGMEQGGLTLYECHLFYSYPMMQGKSLNNTFAPFMQQPKKSYKP